MKKLIYKFLLVMIGMLSIPMAAHADIYVIGNGEDMTWNPTNVYLRGNMNNWDAVDEWMFTYDETTHSYTFDCSGNYKIPAGCEFKFADDNWNTIDFGYSFDTYHRLNPTSEQTIELTFRGDNMYFLQDFDGIITLYITGEEDGYVHFTAASEEITKDFIEADGILYKILNETEQTLTVCGLTQEMNHVKSIEIPETVSSNSHSYTVEAISDQAFASYGEIETVILPESLKSIGFHAFYGCTLLTSINLPKNITSIGDYTFYYCSNLKTINIPENVTSIGDYAFAYCSSLTQINIPGSVKILSTGAFSCCYGLNLVNIPESVTSIEGFAFTYCHSLTQINIPESVKSIGICAFSGCDGLTIVTIPKSVNLIGDYAFRDCINLACIYSYAPNPPQCGNSYVFSGIQSDATLHVPVGTKEAYMKADVWFHFHNNIVDDLNDEETETPDTCVSMSVSDTSIELEVDEETELIVNLKGLKVGTSTLTLTLTCESGEETTETVVISVVKTMTDVTDLFGEDDESMVNIYNLNGILLRNNVRPEAVLELPKGFYIVDDKKIMVR